MSSRPHRLLDRHRLPGLLGGLLCAGALAALSTSCAAGGGSGAVPSRPIAATVSPLASEPVAPAPAPAASEEPLRQPAAPRPVNHCAGNRARQKVVVSLRAQHAWMCAHRHSVYDTAITTGMSGRWTATPTGDYRIQGRNRDTVLTLNTGARYHVRFWIPFDAPLFGFHDSSWQHFPYGSAQYRTHGSHGCIHLPLPAMRFLYHWSARPTNVHIA